MQPFTRTIEAAAGCRDALLTPTFDLRGSAIRGLAFPPAGSRRGRSMLKQMPGAGHVRSCGRSARCALADAGTKRWPEFASSDAPAGCVHSAFVSRGCSTRRAHCSSASLLTRLRLHACGPQRCRDRSDFRTLAERTVPALEPSPDYSPDFAAYLGSLRGASPSPRVRRVVLAETHREPMSRCGVNSAARAGHGELLDNPGGSVHILSPPVPIAQPASSASRAWSACGCFLQARGASHRAAGRPLQRSEPPP